MGLFDGFPFKSREQREREEKQFKKRVLPQGDEGKEKALEVLRQVTDAKIDDSERLWAYFSAKDKYEMSIEDEVEEDVALQRAFKAMDSCRRLSRDGRLATLALIKLEHGCDDLAAEYPTRDVVLTLADELSKAL